MQRSDRIRVSQMVRDLVLATDLAQYMDVLVDMQALAENKVEFKPLLDFDDDHYVMRVPRLKAVCMALVTDYVTKPLPLYLRWRDRQQLEYYNQGDCERARGLDVSPMCDRTTVDWDSFQVGLVDVVALPLWSTLARFTSPDTKMQMRNLSENRRYLASSDEEKAELRQEHGAPHPGGEDGEPLAGVVTPLAAWCPYHSPWHHGFSHSETPTTPNHAKGNVLATGGFRSDRRKTTPSVDRDSIHFPDKLLIKALGQAE